ncbi:MAG: hypothetical protein ACHQUC_07690 [Chlamydiales bacterium]
MGRPWHGEAGIVMDIYCHSGARRLEDLFGAYVADAFMGKPAFDVEDYDPILEQLICEFWYDQTEKD